MTPTTDCPDTDAKGAQPQSSEDSPHLSTSEVAATLSALDRRLSETTQTLSSTDGTLHCAALPPKAARTGHVNQCQGRLQDISHFCCESISSSSQEWDGFSNNCSRCRYEEAPGNLENLCFWRMWHEDDAEWLLGCGWTEGDEGEKVEGEVVIARSALPKGSLLFEQVLEEVTPEVRAVHETSLTFTFVRSKNVKDRYENQTNAADENAGMKGKKISWADPKGLPLKAEFYFKD